MASPWSVGRVVCAQRAARQPSESDVIVFILTAATSLVLVLSAGMAPSSAGGATPSLDESASAGPAIAAATELETVEGVIRLLAADTVSRPAHDHEAPSTHDHELAGQSGDYYKQVLVVGDVAYFLAGVQGEPNTRVRAAGIRNGSSFVAESLHELGRVTGEVPSTGTTNVLVMLAHWNVPDSVTQAKAAAQMFFDTNGWYRDASYTALGQTGDVTPWMQIDGPVDGKCFADHMNTMNQAKAAATAAGYDLSDYQNFVLYSPYNDWQEGSDCNGYAGWAYVGAPNTWLNGYMDRRVTVHEQGHNYGLVHSHSYLCDGVVEGTCTWSDYGDDFDAMGASGLVGHFSASQKALLGWMDGRTVDLTAGGSATLAPLAADAPATSAAVVEASPSRSYWLEYRQAIDYDSSLPGSATDGVLLHVQDRSVSGDDGSNLLDTRPGDGLSVFTATMRAGSAWTTPEGLTIGVDSVTPIGATVKVADLTQPTVVKRKPKPGATGVGPAANATARFSEAVTGVGSATFALTNIETGANVAAVVSRKGHTNTWVLNPSGTLDRRTRYTATLIGGSTAIRDLAGNPLVTTTWSFTTRR